MKNRVLLAFVASVTACAAYAEQVTADMAMAVANEWSVRNAQFGTGNNATNVITVCDTNAAQTVLWHQVSMAGGGCLIIAPVTEIEPIVAALDNDSGELPAAHPLRGILTSDIRRRLRFLNLYEEDAPVRNSRLLGASASAAEAEPAEKAAVRTEWARQQNVKWNRLLVPRAKGSRLLAVEQTQGVSNEDDMPIKVVVPGFEKDGPLTHWDQGTPGMQEAYNYYTPNHAPCGCVATAAAAMMQFFRTAATDQKKIEAGKSNPSCTYNNGPVPGGAATKGGIYDWSQFDGLTTRAQYKNLNPTQREILGRVAYDAGVALGMHWSDGGSGTQESATATAFKDWFGFHEVRCVNNPTQDQFPKLIYAQCRSGAPVGLGISDPGSPTGHSVLAVGYGKDKDGVERVRVFAGWGGAGDAWYALPYIDTASVPGGASYLFTVINCVITMIGYDDDNVVPVYGQLLPTIDADITVGANLTGGGVQTKANANGLFGARVSAAETQQSPRLVELVCQGKTGSVTIGPMAECDANYVSTGGAICKWVPDPVLFPLLNSEVALSFADAQKKTAESFAEGAPKAVFAFSGTWGEEATDAAWNYLYSLDETNEGSFTNKYIVLCAPFSLEGSTESDGNPSIGVFDGRFISLDPNKMWSFYNGRLAYWSINNSVYTNDESLAGMTATNIVIDGELVKYVTGGEITNEMIRVLGEGLTNFLARASGISLTVAHNCQDNPGAATPYDYGSYFNTISNGTEIVETVPAFATNAAGNVEFKCAGWTLASTNSPEVVTNLNTTTAEFTPIPNGAYTLTWLWETNAVKITVTATNGKVEPNTGWFKFGEEVVFTAKTNVVRGTTYVFKSWDPSRLLAYDDEYYFDSGNILAFVVTHPADVVAVFDSVRPRTFGEFKLTVKNYGVDDAAAPDTLVGGAVLPYNTQTNLCDKIPVDIILSDIATTDGTGVTCKGWKLTEGRTNVLDMVACTYYFEGTSGFYITLKGKNAGQILDLIANGEELTPELLAEYEVDYEVDLDGYDPRPLTMFGLDPRKNSITNGASVTLTWLWELPTGTGDDVEDEFDIQWNDGLDNLTIGYTTNLLTVAEMESAGLTLNDLTVNVPVGWKCNLSEDNGNVVATLERDDEVLDAAMQTCSLTIYPNPDDDGTLIVEAEIAAGVRGFWYALYGSNDLREWLPVRSLSGREIGVPDSDYAAGDYISAQAKGTADRSSVKLKAVVTSGESGAGAKRFYKVLSGATKTPLTTN